MPTFETTDRFERDFKRLTREQQALFRKAITEAFIPDIVTGQRFRNGLRVKGVQGAPGVYEMTWHGDGRATFMYGTELTPGEVHIIWRRVGAHDIFTPPPGP